MMNQSWGSGIAVKQGLKPQTNNQIENSPLPFPHHSTKMQYTYRIMTLNINGMESHTRLQMHEEFLQRHDMGIALLRK